jgi:hypothetical protein
MQDERSSGTQPVMLGEGCKYLYSLVIVQKKLTTSALLVLPATFSSTILEVCLSRFHKYSALKRSVCTSSVNINPRNPANRKDFQICNKRILFNSEVGFPLANCIK